MSWRGGGGSNGHSEVFYSLASVVFVCHLYHYSNCFFRLLQWTLLPTKYLPHYFHIAHTIYISVFATPICVYHSSSSHRCIYTYLLDIKVRVLYAYKTSVSPAGLFPITMVLSHSCGETPSCFLQGNLKMKITCSLLTFLYVSPGARFRL
jgi:hypothetical protein